MDAARKLVDKGQLDKAVKEYLRIVHDDPKDVRVWLKIGDLYAKKGAKQDATETYTKVAKFYCDQGFFLKAVAVYKQILKLDPRQHDVTLKLAELFRQLGQTGDAIQHYEAVAAHYHREGRSREALDAVKQLVELDPDNIATRIKLAELCSKESLVDDAALHFDVACEQLRRQGRQDDFVKVAERLLWHKPDHQELHRELAGLYLRRNDPRRALQKLQACFKADPRNPETLGLLALAFQALDQKAKTVSVLKELARIHVESKARDKASEVYRKILEIVPTDADSMQFLGQAGPAAAPAAAAPPPAAARPPSPSARGPTSPPTPPPTASRGAPPAVPTRSTPPPVMRSPSGAPASASPGFSFTAELPSVQQPDQSAYRNSTGSLPLVDAQVLSGSEFALPEYDDPDFSADMQPPPDPRRASAAGERHAAEISKILTETDVYVKYGLHQKAIDHLRRVFSLDADNVEAHERLKDILISQGRDREAEAELLKLAELLAPVDPERAEQYLQDLLAGNSAHTGAYELARRFQLRVTRTTSLSASAPFGGRGGAEPPGDLDDLELTAAPQPSFGVARRRGAGEEVDDLRGRGPLAHGSPAPTRPPQRPADYVPSDQFDAGETSQSTTGGHLVVTEQAMAFDAARSPAARVRWDDAADASTRSEGQAYVGGPYGGDSYQDTGSYESSLDDAVSAGRAAVAPGSGLEQGDELASGADDLPFDPDDARAFDALVGGRQDASPVDEADYELGQTADGADGGDPMMIPGSYDPYGHVPQGGAASRSALEPDGLDEPGPEGLDEHPPTRAESVIEDELESVDFYISQGLYGEARESLTGLFERFPGHRLLLAKLYEIDALEAGDAPELVTPPAGNALAARASSLDDDLDLAGPLEATGGTAALDVAELEEVGDDELELVEDHDDAAPAAGRRQPSVLLAKPVDESDADTHYDLGLAYREMGLYGDAIKAFEQVLRVPGREVQCRVMIGMCHRQQGNTTEAILQFKQGLHAEPESESERLSLYYEIGITHESMGDAGEALYYFETVAKRDPRFADAAQRASALRARGGRAIQPPEDDL